MEVVVIPTSGNRRGVDGHLEPGVNCIRRLKTAIEHCPSGEGVMLTFVGGLRDNPDTSEAAIATNYFWEHYSQVAYCQTMTVAPAKYTAGDMVGLSKILQEERAKGVNIDRIWIVTHPDHAKLAARTLKRCGWDCVHLLDSGEPPPYNRWELIILKIVYWLDPKWQDIWSLPLRALANRRGRDE